MTDDICGSTDTDSGEPCGRPAGWGTDADDGPCADHQGDSCDTRARMFDPDQVERAIRENNGNLAAAARSLGCSRMTVYRFCEEFDQCEHAKVDARATLVDEATDTLRDLLTDEDKSIQLKAAKFINKHYDDDAKTRTDVTSDDDHVQARQDALDELDEMSSEEKVQLWRQLSEVHDDGD